jgi:hypothetical protein
MSFYLLFEFLQIWLTGSALMWKKCGLIVVRFEPEVREYLDPKNMHDSWWLEAHVSKQSLLYQISRLRDIRWG